MDIKQTIRKSLRYIYFYTQSNPEESFAFEQVIIITTKYLVHVARAISLVLRKQGVSTEIIFDYKKNAKSALYIVLCPQFFKKLPKRRIVYNFEQAGNLSFFSKSDYLMFKKSLGVLDFSSGEVLKHWPSISSWPYYDLSIGALPENEYPTYSGVIKRYDLVFIGDINARRRELLNKLNEHFSIRILSGFPDQIAAEIPKAKACINIHYNDPSCSLFESVRFFQCLNQNLPMVSERSIDQHKYNEFNEVLLFVDSSDISDFISKTKMFLNYHDRNLVDYGSLRRNSYNYFAGNLLLTLAKIGIDLNQKRFDAVGRPQ